MKKQNNRNEEDIIPELLQKVELHYPFEHLEETVLQKIEIRTRYKKQQATYTLIGKVGFGCFLCLCLLFALIIGGADLEKITNTLYLLIGIPFLLLLFLVQLEILISRKVTKESSL